jgi:PDDEXK-like domain of unknown function (DUF3799)
MIYKVGKYTSDQLSLEAYHHEVEAISKTNLDHLHLSFQHYLESKKDQRSPLSGALPKCLVEGAALHCLVLTPGEFTKEFRVLPSLNRRTREGKALYEQLLSYGKPVIPAPVFSRLEAMAGAIVTHPAASELLKGGIPESSYIWVDPDTGVMCKCRPDYIQGSVIPDLKTCQDASYEAFQRAIIEHRYHVQGAYFIDGVNAVLQDGKKRSFNLIAVEKAPPFAVAVYRLTDDALELGRAIYKEDLIKYKTHIEDPTLWMGYSPKIQGMSLPPWAKRVYKPEEV